MNENENENVSGHSHSLSEAGDGPEEIARQVRRAIIRSGRYVATCGFVRINNKPSKKGVMEIEVSKGGMSSFRGGDIFATREELIGNDRLKCYLCDRSLDIRYQYIVEGMKKLLPLTYYHVCCMCKRMVDNPDYINLISLEEESPYVLIDIVEVASLINVFHLIRYLNAIDKQKADLLRKKFEEEGVSLNPKKLREFYK